MTKKATKVSKAKAAEETKKTEQPETTQDTGNEKTNQPKENSEKENTLQETEGENNGDNSGMTYEQAEIDLNIGAAIKLPEWKGCWFNDITTGKTYVLLDDGNIVDTPHESYKERNDWQIAELTDEQNSIIKEFWNTLSASKEQDVDAAQKEIEEDNIKQNEEYNKLHAIAYNRGKNTSFIKLKKTISIEDLHERKHLPYDAVRDSEFVMNNGYVFDLESSQLTNKKS